MLKGGTAPLFLGQCACRVMHQLMTSADSKNFFGDSPTRDRGRCRRCSRDDRCPDIDQMNSGDPLHSATCEKGFELAYRLSFIVTRRPRVDTLPLRVDKSDIFDTQEPEVAAQE